MSGRAGGMPSIYPYLHRCWCGESWTVTEEHRVDHEAEVVRHRQEHRAADRRMRLAEAVTA